MGLKLTKFDEGVWNITTLHSSYVVDLDKYLFGKITHSPEKITLENIKVEQWFKLIDLYAFLGGTMNIAIKPLDSEHMAELMSSNIVSITKIS
jgi:hypothetical protein